MMTPTVRLMAPVLVAGQLNPAVTGNPVNVNGRIYPPVAPGTVIDVPDFDAACLCANGYTRIAISGPTSARPTTNQASGSLYYAAPGVTFLDITIGALVVFDGKTWRNPVTGGAA
jgi:hypothetical protein